MTPEERAEIRVLAEIPAEKLTLSFEFYYRRDIPRLLAALDVCEAERDRAVELLRGVMACVESEDFYADALLDPARAFLAEESNE